MARILMALVAGLLFGLGLTVSQMINPAKVLGFLDLFGDWDPSLVLVMVGAIAVAALGYRLARRSPVPFCAPVYAVPLPSKIDGRLVVGAVLFGIGWGMVGYCPGPALASLGLGNSATILFLAAMLIGMAGFTAFQSRAMRRLHQV
jgi:uncharacterized membrane protein YedE/YeeE